MQPAAAAAVVQEFKDVKVAALLALKELQHTVIVELFFWPSASIYLKNDTYLIIYTCLNVATA